MLDQGSNREPDFTEEQEEIMQQGLRILARMIVRAHLASLNEETVKNKDTGFEDSTGRTAVTEQAGPDKEDERAA